MKSKEYLKKEVRKILRRSNCGKFICQASMNRFEEVHSIRLFKHFKYDTLFFGLFRFSIVLSKDICRGPKIEFSTKLKKCENKGCLCWEGNINQEISNICKTIQNSGELTNREIMELYMRKIPIRSNIILLKVEQDFDTIYLTLYCRTNDNIINHKIVKEK